MRAGLAHATFAQRRALVELLIDRVIVTDEAVEIRYVMPTSPDGPHHRFCHLRKDHFNEVSSGSPLHEALNRRLSWGVNQRVGIAARFVEPANHEPLRIGRGSRLRTVSRGAHLEECQVGREHPAFVIICIVQKASHLAGTNNARFGRIVLMAQQAMSLVIAAAHATSCRTRLFRGE